MDIHGYIGVDIGLECRLGGFHHRFHKGVVVLRENQRERHFETGDTDIVLQHSALYEVLTRPRVPHMPKSIYYLLRIHEKYLRFTDLRCTIYLRFGHWIIFSLTFATAKVLLIFDIRKHSGIFLPFYQKICLRIQAECMEN